MFSFFPFCLSGRESGFVCGLVCVHLFVRNNKRSCLVLPPGGIRALSPGNDRAFIGWPVSVSAEKLNEIRLLVWSGRVLLDDERVLGKSGSM